MQALTSGNAVFSGGCGLILLLAAAALSGPFGVPAWLLAGMGVGLIAFAGLLLWILADPARLVPGGRAAFYYRILLYELAQTWSLESAAQGTRVTLTFDASLKLGVIGAIVGKLLARQLRIEDILSAYEHELRASPSASP